MLNWFGKALKRLSLNSRLLESLEFYLGSIPDLIFDVPISPPNLLECSSISRPYNSISPCLNSTHPHSSVQSPASSLIVIVPVLLHQQSHVTNLLITRLSSEIGVHTLDQFTRGNVNSSLCSLSTQLATTIGRGEWGHKISGQVCENTLNQSVFQFLHNTLSDQLALSN